MFFLLSEQFQSLEQISHSRLNSQDRIKIDTDSESLIDSNICSQVKIYSKIISLWVKNATEVDMIEIEGTLRANSQKLCFALKFEFGHFPNMLREYSKVVFPIRLMYILLLSADKHRTSSSTSFKNWELRFSILSKKSL